MLSQLLEGREVEGEARGDSLPLAMALEADRVLIEQLHERLDNQPVMAIAAIEVLMGVIERSSAATMMGLQRELDQAKSCLLRHAASPEATALRGRPLIAVESGCELFLRHVMREFASLDFGECRALLLRRAAGFTAISSAARERIAQLGAPFVRGGAVVLTHGLSRVALAVLAKADADGREFSLVVPEGRVPGTAHKSGYEIAAAFAAAGVRAPVSVILDAAVATAMESVDLCIVGAEGVLENGGVVNKARRRARPLSLSRARARARARGGSSQPPCPPRSQVGTYQIARCARAHGKPLYVAAESGRSGI